MASMKNIVYKISSHWVTRLILVAIFVATPIIYFLIRAGDSTFLDSTMGNWFATLIGAFAGVFAALELNRWQEKRENEKRESENKIIRKKETEHSINILELIGEELSYNKAQIEGSRNIIGNHMERVVLLDGLKVELWDALSNGGELQWIKNPVLIDLFSRAYYYIRRESFLETMYLNNYYSHQTGRSLIATSQDKLIETLGEFDTLTLESIDRALKQKAHTIADLKET